MSIRVFIERDGQWEQSRLSDRHFNCDYHMILADVIRSAVVDVESRTTTSVYM